MLYKVPTDLELQQRVVGVNKRVAGRTRISYLHFLLLHKPQVQYIDPDSAAIWIGNVSNTFHIFGDRGSSFTVLKQAVMQVELLFPDAIYAWKVKAIESIQSYYPEDGQYME